MQGSKSKSHVAFLLGGLHEGGAQRQLYVLLKGLAEKNIRISVVCLYSGGLFWDRVKALSHVTLVSLEKSGRWDMLSVAWKLLIWARETRPNVLHGYMTVGNLMAFAAGVAVSSAKVIWGVRTSNVHLKNFDFLEKTMFWFEKRLSNYIASVIFNSVSGQTSYLEAGFRPNACYVIPNGIDTVAFCAHEYRRREVRKRLGISNEALVIGHVGRLTPVKGHTLFLETAARFTRLKVDCPVMFLCVTAGSESYLEKMKDLSRSLGLEAKLIWVKDESDMPQYYNAMDIMVSTSYVEGFSNTIGEAMACEVPCVVADCGDSGLIVGDDAFVVPIGDGNRLLECWVRMLEVDRVALGKRMRSRVQEKFSVSRMVEATWRVVQSSDVPLVSVWKHEDDA